MQVSHYHHHKYEELMFKDAKYKGNMSKGAKLMECYNIRSYTKLGIVVSEIRRISCAHDKFIVMLDRKWESGLSEINQSKYQTPNDCRYADIFDGNWNKWNIVTMGPEKIR